MSITNSREVAMKTLFACSLGGDYFSEADSETEETPSLSEKETRYCRTLIDGVRDNEAELRQIIADHSEGWSVDRIGKVELCILLISTFEILHLPDVPLGASINEAVKLAKEYGDDRSPAFINGILGSIGRKYRNQ